MRKYLFLLSLLLWSISTFSQSKADLKKENAELKTAIETYKQALSERDAQLQLLRNEFAKIQASMEKIAGILGEGTVTNSLTPTVPTTGKVDTQHQCKAITAAGIQCSRSAEAGSDYCWQHKKSSSSDSYSGSKTIQTGPRGGKYYINSKGNKTYVKRK